jgi:hypothetical protein
MVTSFYVVAEYAVGGTRTEYIYVGGSLLSLGSFSAAFA